MPDRKISQLTAGGAAQATDEYVIARSGNNFKVTGANVAAAATSVGTLTSLTVSGNATFDTNTLFVDAANNRVGVGIASSLASVLHIKGPAGSNPATGGIVFQYSTNSNNYGAIGLDNASGSFAVLAGSGAELRFHTNSDLATTNLRWRMDTNGHFLANADNSFDIGASGATRPRNVFVAGNVTAGGNLTAGNSISLSVNASGPVTISATNTSTNAAATARLELGSQAGNWYIENRRTSGALAFTFGTDRMLLDSSGNITAGGNINISAGNVLHLAGAGGNTYLQESSGTLFLGAGGAGRVQVNAFGNLGLGVTPSVWTVRALQLGATTAVWQESASTFLSANVYFDGSNRYISTAAASRYEQNAGSHRWFSAASGTAGNAITFTQAMTLDANGNLGVGTATPVNVAAGSVTVDVAATTSRSASVWLHGNNQSGTTAGFLLQSDTVSDAYVWNYANRSLFFGTNNTSRWTINGAGHFLAGTDNTFDIGASGATRPRDIYAGSSVRSSDVFIASSAYWAGTTKRTMQYMSGDEFRWVRETSAGVFEAVAMSLSASGNLGVGTTPSARLHVLATSEAARFAGSAGNMFASFYSGTSSVVGYVGSGSGVLSAGGDLNFGVRAEADLIFCAGGGTRRATITSTGNFVAGGSVALATNATNGFLYVPTCAGTPTGTPSTITGMAPIVVDTTNNKLYFYSGGQWRDAGP